MMLEKIKNRIKKDELIGGGIILFVMINIFNFMNYVYHFSMARMLGPSDYGVLAVLFSFIYIFSIPSESIQSIIADYTSKLRISNEAGKIKYLFYKSIKKSFRVSLLGFIIFIPFAYVISSSINVAFELLVFTGLLIFLSTSIPIGRGIMQGEKNFFGLGNNLIIEGILKVSLGLIFVLIGWRVFGAILGVIIAVGIAFLIGLVSIKKILNKKSEETKFNDIYTDYAAYFFVIIAIVLFYSLDIIFAKIFFDSKSAGVYAVASMLGKIIFFGSFATGKAMLPIISEENKTEKETFNILKKALKIVGFFSLVVLFFYFFFPEIIIKILFGKEYLSASGILFFIGISFALLSLTNLIFLYKLITRSIKRPYFLSLFVLVEIVIFYLLHKDLLEFSLGFLFSSIIFFVASLCLLMNKK